MTKNVLEGSIDNDGSHLLQRNGSRICYADTNWWQPASVLAFLSLNFAVLVLIANDFLLD
jgi:hypothetical protein